MKKEPKGIPGPKGACGPIEFGKFLIWPSKEDFPSCYLPLQPSIRNGKYHLLKKDIEAFHKYLNVKLAVKFVTGVEDDETWWTSSLGRILQTPEVKEIHWMYRELKGRYAKIKAMSEVDSIYIDEEFEKEKKEKK